MRDDRYKQPTLFAVTTAYLFCVSAIKVGKIAEKMRKSSINFYRLWDKYTGS